MKREDYANFKLNRYMMIRAAALKIQGKPTRKATKLSNRKYDVAIAKLDENYNHWTDASAYANKVVGEVAYETTRFDNDWN